MRDISLRAWEALILSVPEWARERPIYVFAGRELIYKKELDGPWERKTVRCNLCGECCRDVGPTWPWRDPETGDCSFLKHEIVHKADGTVIDGFFCKAPGPIVPFTCCVGRDKDPEKCVIRFEPVR